MRAAGEAVALAAAVAVVAGLVLRYITGSENRVSRALEVTWPTSTPEDRLARYAERRKAVRASQHRASVWVIAAGCAGVALGIAMLAT